MSGTPEQELYAWVTYLRDMGIYDLYRRDGASLLSSEALERLQSRGATTKLVPVAQERGAAAQAVVGMPQPPPSGLPGRPGQVSPGMAERTPPPSVPHAPLTAPAVPGPRQARMPAPIASLQGGEPLREALNMEEGTQQLPPELAAPMPKPNPLEDLFPMPVEAVPFTERAAALERLRATIGDCTRCPPAYAGRHTIVFGEGDPAAQLMFVGEGPGADEDARGRPFVGKAGQLLNNMITAMGLVREQVFIANIVKCRPPGNRAPEFVEATTCSQFLLQQIDIVRPRIIVALGSTAATYLLGVRQSLSSLRGQWLSCRGAKVAVTYHPAFLLRDPRQKAEAWKDLQRVMAELGLRSPAKSG